MGNTEEDTCGYDAYVTATKIKHTLQNFRKNTQLLNNFSIETLLMVAKQDNVNLLVVEKNNLYIQKSINSDFFHTIIHSNATPKTEEMHYYVGSITLNSHLNTYHSPRAGATTTQINTLITAWGYNTQEFIDHFYNLHDNLVMEIGYENLMGIISSKITS